VVALGAAIQGAVLAGDVKDMLLLDVTPLSLGIETLGGVMTTLIEKNTTIPVKKSEMFSTAEDNQPAVTVHVLQGERQMAADNKTLGRFELTGIPPGPRGQAQIEVTFDIDANGIVNVSATDRATGKAQSIRITASSGLTQAEIDRAIGDAERNASEDAGKRMLVDARNTADALIYTMEKSISETRGHLDSGAVRDVQAAIAELREAMSGSDTARIKTLTQRLETQAHAMTASAYQSGHGNGPAAAGGRGSGPAARPPEDEVVDAEFQEVA